MADLDIARTVVFPLGVEFPPPEARDYNRPPAPYDDFNRIVSENPEVMVRVIESALMDPSNTPRATLNGIADYNEAAGALDMVLGYGARHALAVEGNNREVFWGKVFADAGHGYLANRAKIAKVETVDGGQAYAEARRRRDLATLHICASLAAGNYNPLAVLSLISNALEAQFSALEQLSCSKAAA